MATNGLEGLGFHHMWGYSPAMDVIDVMDLIEAENPFDHGSETTEETTTPLNILLIKCSDIRHVLKTVSQRLRHKTNRPLHVSVLNHCHT